MPRSAVTSGRIVIVDDDERRRTALAAMLSEDRFETQVAADGQDALERLAAFNADVIVSDLMMPRMDGFELLRHLQEHFLDEIGEMPPSTQPKLLRALEDLRVRRLGCNTEIAVNARLLAATSHSLEARLREELYYRLSVAFRASIPGYWTCFRPTIGPAMSGSFAT